MKEKILAALQTKFAGVDAQILNRIADKKAIGVTDESQINSIVEGINFSDVLNSYGDYRANGAVSSAVQNYEKKYGLKEGKPIESPIPPIEKPSQPTDLQKIVSEAVAQAVSPLAAQLTTYQQKEQAAERWNIISAKGKEYGIPEFILKGRQIADDADLDAVCKDLKQEMSNAGFEGVKAPESAEQAIKKNEDEIIDLISKTK